MRQGHTHDSFDYNINGTRVICNPRGYSTFDANPVFNPNLVIEIKALIKLWGLLKNKHICLLLKLWGDL